MCESSYAFQESFYIFLALFLWRGREVIKLFSFLVEFKVSRKVLSQVVKREENHISSEIKIKKRRHVA